jgi:hypothetical protein
VANAGLKVAGFSVICRRLVRAAGKEVRETKLKVERGKLKEEEDIRKNRVALDDRLGRGRVGQGRNIEDGSMDLDYCQGISTIVLSFECETRKWSDWKELAGIL